MEPLKIEAVYKLIAIRAIEGTRTTNPYVHQEVMQDIRAGLKAIEAELIRRNICLPVEPVKPST